jgi:hypothetical protein
MREEEDNSVVLQIGEDDGSLPEEDYENECGYWLIKLFRGRTLGRRLKRELCKLSLFELLTGTVMLTLTIVDQVNFSITPYFTISEYGGSLLSLQYSVAFSALIFGFAGILAIKYWASLVTNRELLGKILRIYQFCLVIFFTISLWCLCAIFLTFRNVKWNVSQSLLNFILPYNFNVYIVS